MAGVRAATGRGAFISEPRASARAGLLIIALACCARASIGGVVPPPNYGHSFVTVGAPGNRPALESERIYGAAVTGFPNLGQVNHEYRIDRLEMTVRQWYDFVQVAWPTALSTGESPNSPAFLGGHIGTTGSGGPTTPWIMAAGWENVATAPSFRYAAWYCNWLHNGRPTTNITMDTFTTGAYDLNTMTRNPGALYWIPSLDEWTKATYYDPNRYGAGLEGYWKYPGMSDVPLVGGPPGTPGAQTSGGSWQQSPDPPPAVGSYPDVMSAWGLLDTSGGESEWTDTLRPGPSLRVLVRGQDEDNGLWDRIDYLFAVNTVSVPGHGVRIASAIPAPGVGALFIAVLTLTQGRRRRM